MGRFDQISPTTKGVKPNKKPDMGKTMSMDVVRGEKRMVCEVREGLVNNQVDNSTGGSRDTSSKHKLDGMVALPK